LCRGGGEGILLGDTGRKETAEAQGKREDETEGTG